MAESGKISITSLPLSTQRAIESLQKRSLPCTRESLMWCLVGTTEEESISLETLPDLDYYLPPEVNFPDDLDLEDL